MSERESTISNTTFPFKNKETADSRESVHTYKEALERWAPIKPTIIFETYWRFAAERQAIFFRRYNQEPGPWTNDPIFKKFKFTNAYRLLDRVTQFLIKHVIYKGEQSAKEVFFRIMLFKLFNKIETWNLLTNKFDAITWSDYSFKKYEQVLSAAKNNKKSIYSAAYIMPSGCEAFGYPKKHCNHLCLIEVMMKDRLYQKLEKAKSMQKAFELLREYPTIGDFLAYQFVTDINYSNLTNFSEMEFVIPGPGARNGIHKCFLELGGLNEVELIKRIADLQVREFENRNIEFLGLHNRPLQLIDCQNLFCEIDKYSRVAYPDFGNKSCRKRIKQLFRPNSEPIDYYFPSKWNIMIKN